MKLNRIASEIASKTLRFNSENLPRDLNVFTGNFSLKDDRLIRDFLGFMYSRITRDGFRHTGHSGFSQKMSNYLDDFNRRFFQRIRLVEMMYPFNLLRDKFFK